MSVLICDRCGDVVVEPDTCRCATPFDPVEVRRRHRQAVLRARESERLERAGRRRSHAA